MAQELLLIALDHASGSSDFHNHAVAVPRPGRRLQRPEVGDGIARLNYILANQTRLLARGCYSGKTTSARVNLVLVHDSVLSTGQAPSRVSPIGGTCLVLDMLSIEQSKHVGGMRALLRLQEA